MLIVIDFDPIIARLGPFELGWHGLFTAVAVLVAVQLGLRSAERAGWPRALLGSVVTWAIVGGVVGARLFHVLDHIDQYAAAPLTALAIWQGGIAVYGAFLGGIAAGLIAARRNGLPPWPLLDAAAPAMLVGQAIGRLGCLSNGDAWGAPTGAAWGVVYRNANDLLPAALLGVPTHPYPLYEIVAEVALLGVLALGRRRALRRPGSVFLAAALGYAIIRSVLTSFRQEAAVLGGLQEAQVVALITGLAALGVAVVRWRRIAPPPASG